MTSLFRSPVLPVRSKEIPPREKRLALKLKSYDKRLYDDLTFAIFVEDQAGSIGSHGSEKLPFSESWQDSNIPNGGTE